MILISLSQQNLNRVSVRAKPGSIRNVSLIAKHFVLIQALLTRRYYEAEAGRDKYSRGSKLTLRDPYHIEHKRGQSLFNLEMGIQGLMKLIGDYAPSAVKDNDIKNYFGKSHSWWSIQDVYDDRSWGWLYVT